MNLSKEPGKFTAISFTAGSLKDRLSDTLSAIENEVAPRIQSSMPFETYSIGQMGFDQFFAVFEETRNELALRRLKGEKLNAKEFVLLTILNRKMDDLLYRPPAKGFEKFLDALNEGERLLAAK